MTKIAPIAPSVLNSNSDQNTKPKKDNKSKKSMFSEKVEKVTKQENQKCKYDFVYNNYKVEEIPQIIIVLKSLCKRFVFGEEIGEVCKTPHLQGFIDLKVKARITELKKLIPYEFSYRECRNEQALMDYCQKEGKVINYGCPKPLKILKEESFYDWQKEAYKIALNEPDDRSIYYFYETEGNVGKSAFVKHLVHHHKALFIDEGKKSDIINLAFNTDMRTCELVILDVPRANGNKISYKTLESLKNGLICNTKYETGVATFNPPTVMVFSNSPPNKDDKGLSADRWRIAQIINKKLVWEDV